MKKNLSPEALKGFRKETNTTPLKRRNPDGTGTPPNAAVQVSPLQAIFRFLNNRLHLVLTIHVDDARHPLSDKQNPIGTRRQHATATDSRGGKQTCRL